MIKKEGLQKKASFNNLNDIMNYIKLKKEKNILNS